MIEPISEEERYKQHAIFRQEVNHLIKFEHSRFHDILKDENYPFLTKEEKEKYIFDTTLGLCEFYDTVNDFLEYLILDYKIPEEYYLKVAHPNGYKPVEDMFAKRKIVDGLVKELHEELDNKNNKSSNRIKV